MITPRDWRIGVLVIVLAQVVTELSGQSTRPISIYIGPVIKAGFADVDQGVRDSIRDLQRELRHFRGFVLATDQATADLTLRVVERHVGRNPNGAATLVSFHVLTTILEVGDYRKEFMTAVRGIGGEWRECAEQIMKQVDAWAVANRDQILVQAAQSR
jgi:hypothetical protein